MNHNIAGIHSEISIYNSKKPWGISKLMSFIERIPCVVEELEKLRELNGGFRIHVG